MARGALILQQAGDKGRSEKTFSSGSVGFSDRPRFRALDGAPIRARSRFWTQAKQQRPIHRSAYVTIGRKRKSCALQNAQRDFSLEKAARTPEATRARPCTEDPRMPALLLWEREILGLWRWANGRVVTNCRRSRTSEILAKKPFGAQKKSGANMRRFCFRILPSHQVPSPRCRMTLKRASCAVANSKFGSISVAFL